MANIVIAEDHSLIVEGLRGLFETKGYTVLHAANEVELLAILRSAEVGILIQDIRFGSVDARKLIPLVRAEFKELPILALSSLDDFASIQSVLSTQVNGYVVKTEPTSVLLEAVQSLESGKTFLSPEVQKVLMGNVRTTDEIILSEREKAVLNGILNEKSTKEIADVLFVSEKTVEHYRGSLFSKFDVKNVSGLVKKAILLGFYDG